MGEEFFTRLCPVEAREFQPFAFHPAGIGVFHMGDFLDSPFQAVRIPLVVYQSQVPLRGFLQPCDFFGCLEVFLEGISLMLARTLTGNIEVSERFQFSWKYTGR